MKNKRSISLLLILLMLFSSLPVGSIRAQAENLSVVETPAEAGQRPKDSAFDQELLEVGKEKERDLKSDEKELLAQPPAENIEEPKNSQEDLDLARSALEQVKNAKDKNLLKETQKAKEAIEKLKDSLEKEALQKNLEDIDVSLKKVSLYWTYEGVEEKQVVLDMDKGIGNNTLRSFDLSGAPLSEDFRSSRVEYIPTVNGAKVEIIDKRELPETNSLQIYLRVTSRDGSKSLRYTSSLTTGKEEIGKKETIDKVIETLSNFYKGTSEDWSSMALASLGRQKDVDESKLITVAKQVVAKNKSSTDLERVTIALTSLGYDMTQFQDSNGKNVNVIEMIANHGGSEYGNDLGTLNGYIFALIAYDSGSYEIPAGSKWTRDKTIDYILDHQLPDNGWNLNNEGKGDSDITAMTIQALAPYYKTNPRVKTAVDKSLDFLSGIQNTGGDYAGSFGGFGTSKNSNSTAMVLVALNNLGIDGDTDQRFIKEGKSILDGLLSFKTGDDHFGYISNDEKNGMATEQSFRAIIGYREKKNIYQFSPPTKTIANKVLPKSLEIMSLPKTRYKLNESMDLSGLRAKVIWSDGSFTYPETYDLQVQGLETETSGNKLVFVSYKGVSDVFYVLVEDGGPLDPQIPENPKDPIKPADPQKPSEKRAYVSVIVPPGPTIMNSGKVMFSKGDFPIIEGKDTAFSLLQKTGLRYLYNYHELYAGVYVSSIEGLAEFDGGPYSGWMYRVNGKFPDHSSSLYKVKSGDYVEWLYTRDLGKDVGGYVDGVENDDGLGGKAFNVFASASNGGSIAPSGKVRVTTKKPVTFTLIPDEGYVVLDLMVDGVSQGAIEKFMARADNIKADSKIQAIFKKKADLTEAEKKKVLEGQKNTIQRQEKGQTEIGGFADIQGHWAYKYIKYVIEKEYFKGIGDNKFGPNINMSRGMFVTVLGRMSGENITENTSNFVDVSRGSFYEKYVKWAHDNGIVKGVGENTFQPEREITREEMAQMMASYLRYKNIDLSKKRSPKYSDRESVSDWAKKAVDSMYEAKILNGKDDGKFHPKDVSTRGEVATVIAGIDKQMDKKN